MKIVSLPTTLCFMLLAGCSTPDKPSSINIDQEVSNLPSIKGKSQYLASPFVTAGDRVYMVGFQDGSFPDLGWHIGGEMGGVWDHPIKLMDGFTASIAMEKGRSFCLDKADTFSNYPMANRHHFTWDQEQLEINRTQFVPDGTEGMVVEFQITNHSEQAKEIIFSFTGMMDLRPTWLGDRTNMVDAEDEVSFDDDLSVVIANDKNNPWYCVFGSSKKATKYSAESDNCPRIDRKGLGKNATLSYSLTVKANAEITIPVFIAGSYQSETSARSTFDLLKSNGHEKLVEKINRYKEIDNTAHLTIPDKNIGQMYAWLKYNIDWLVRNVPEQGIGLSAGLPDYPWWFGTDATYSLQGALATGNFGVAKNTILLLHKISQQTNTNGRIIHEVSTNGSVYNPGNVNETAQFITLINTYYSWTGDKELITQLFPDVKKGMQWLLKEKDPDGNHYPNGSGMMEIPGLESELEMIDVAVYTQQALASAAALALVVGEKATAAEYQTLADELKNRINNDWWQPTENSFGDFRGTVANATPILAAAIVRCDTLGKSWAVAELKKTQKLMRTLPSGKTLPHVIYHNWVVNTPMETGVADADKAQAALKKAKTYENPFGVFVTGIDRTEEPDSIVLKSRKKIFSYTGAVMTLPTGVQAVAAARYGSQEDALEYITKLSRSFSFALPGSMYEVSPDFGMMTQAWNSYGVAVPIINYFFGIHPAAAEKTITLSPRMPLQWKEATVENVKVGDNALSLTVSQKADYKEYSIQQTHADWTVVVDIKGAKKVMVDDKELDLATSKDHLILKGRKIVVRIY